MPRFLVYIWLGLELLTLIILLKLLGFLGTVLLYIFTTILGFAILRHHGGHMMAQWRQVASGQPLNLNEWQDAPWMLLGGSLLVLPGFFTDIIGIVCLLPGWRRKITQWFLKQFGQAAPTQPSNQHGQVYEGEYKHVPDKKINHEDKKS